jgi:hypothetical protein
MRESFQLSSLFKQFDFFAEQKRESLQSAKSYCLDLAEELQRFDRESGVCEKGFGFFLRCALWANKCDMSITGGEE